MDLKKIEGGQSISKEIKQEKAMKVVGILHQQIPRREFDDPHPPPQAAPTQLPSGDRICAQCADLDLRGALREAARLRNSPKLSDRLGTWKGTHVANVGHRYRQRQLGDCALCTILSASRIGPEQGIPASKRGDEIRLFEFLNTCGYFPNAKYPHPYESAFIAVSPRHFGSNIDGRRDIHILRDHVQIKGAAVLYQDSLPPAEIAVSPVPASFNATIAASWLHHCKSNHLGPCVFKGPAVPGLRLINCETFSIVAAESNNPFVTLSYVWGASNHPDDMDTKVRRVDNRFLLPERLAPVISDAIAVTKALGFQYLWVDKLCIDQDDQVQKHEQIKQMSAIYENADLTIVAAAGVDETYGLPGVGQRPRVLLEQKLARFNGLNVISTMTSPHVSTRSSRWFSRGWTFQEAVLSRRLLIFTDQQLAFECNAMSCFESIRIPIARLDVGYDPRLHRELRADPEMFSKHLKDPDGPALIDMFQFYYLLAVQNYSPRDLTYDSDSLNAFQGIIQRCSKSRKPIFAIWGMPYPAQRAERLSYFCWALTWVHAKSCWDNSRRPRRRLGFPSWTWAGWAGAVHILHSVQDISCVCSGIQSVRFGDRDCDEEDLNSLDRTTPESMCRVLRFLAKLLPASLFSCRPAEGCVMSWKFAMFDATLFASQDRMMGPHFVQELMDVREWRCVWICSNRRDSFCMVLELNHRTCTWTRAGMFLIDCHEDLMNFFTENAEPMWYSVE